MEFFDNIKMNSNQFIDSRFELVSSLPTSNLFVGRLVFNSTDNAHYYYNGTNWVSIIDSKVFNDTIGNISDVLSSVVEV